MSDFDYMLRLGVEKQALTSAELEAAAAKTHTAPSAAQKEVGNYRKGRAAWKGLELVIENPKDSTRSGVGKDGKAWSTTMKDHYGYFGATKSKADGDAVDFFLNDEHLDSEIVFVVNQNNEDGTFDEHKVVLGCINVDDAKKTYLRNYSKGWTGLGSIKAMVLDDFKTWVKSSPSKAAADEPTEKRYLSRYKCPVCGSTNAYNGPPGTGMTFRGSGWCENGCSFSIVGSKLQPIGQGPEIVPTEEQLEKKRKWDEWVAKQEKEGSDVYVPQLWLVKRAEDDDTPFTVAVDLDGTIAKKEEPFNPETIGEPIEDAIAYVRQFKEAGARIIIFTVRGDTAMVEKWLEEHDVPYDFINENPDQPKDSSGKVIADVYWDDRAYNAEDPHEHGPAILDRITEEDEGDLDQTDGPVMMVQRTTTTIMIHPHAVLAGLTEQHHDDES